MTKNNNLSTEIKASYKLHVANLSGLIRDDAPAMIWEGKLCKKKVVLAHELHDIILPSNKGNRVRNINEWLSKGFEGVDFIDPENYHITSKEDMLSESIIIKAKVGNGAKRKIRSAYLRVEFAKKICMAIKTPEADAIRDYLLRETRAFWDMIDRRKMALPAPAPAEIPTAIQQIIADAVQKATEVGRIQGFEQGKASAEYNKMALADLRVSSTMIRYKKDLRADIVRTVKQIAIKKKYDYRWLWRQIYSSFAIQTSSCLWRGEWHNSTNKIEFLMNDNIDIKYLRRLRDIVQSWE